MCDVAEKTQEEEAFFFSFNTDCNVQRVNTNTQPSKRVCVRDRRSQPLPEILNHQSDII